MLKKITAIMLRDLKSGLRDFMVIFIIVIPFLLAFALSLFVPSAGATTYQFAVDEKVGTDVVEYLAKVGQVEVIGEGKSVEDRVLQTDDIAGISKDGDRFEVLLEGNEAEGIAEVTQQILMHLNTHERNLPLEIRFSSIGWSVSPLAQYGAISLIIMTTILGGMMIAFNIVEEKQSGTISAVNVSPAGRFEFIAGKSILGFIIPVIQSLGVMLIFKFTGVNLLMLALIVLCSALVGVILGFVIGLISNDQISAVSNMKLTFLPVTGSILGGILLSSEWLPVLYWSPFYWTFAAVNELILKEATWGSVLTNCGAIGILSLLIYLILRKKIQKGLA